MIFIASNDSSTTMVLEEIPSDPDPYYSPSSSDPFQSSSSSSTIFPVDFSNLPQPIPFSWLWGFTQARVQKRISLQVDRASTTLKRRLRPEEFEAISYYHARAERLSSLGAPLGLAAGFYQLYTTREEGRFPFQRFLKNRNWAFNGNMLSYADWKLVQGPRAAFLVASLRSSCYLSIGYFCGSLLLGSYGASVATVGMIQDKRLDDLMTTMDRLARERRGLPPEAPSSSGRASIPDTSRRQDPTGQGRRSAGELWTNHRTAIGANTQDDASPTAGNEDFFGRGSSTEPGEGVVVNDSQMRRRERRQQPPEPRDFTSDYTSSTPSTDDSSYASSSASSDGLKGGESTWERIRRENASGGSTPSMGRWQMRQGGQQQEQQEGSTLDDSFSFSRTEERSYAQDEAQKQFDERVDQERRGEDFGARGWRR